MGDPLLRPPTYNNYLTKEKIIHTNYSLHDSHTGIFILEYIASLCIQNISDLQINEYILLDAHILLMKLLMNDMGDDDKYCFLDGNM